jgi:hypothetical protein
MHAALAPDLAASPEVGFIHRKLADGEIYFLANTSNRTVRTQAKFRVQGMQSQQWNPFTAEAVGAGGSAIDFELAPYESRVVVFARGIRDQGSGVRGAAPSTIEISGWTLAFPNGQPAPLQSLHSWTDEPGRQFYSGQATYEANAKLPDLAKRRWILNFGEGTPVAAPERRSGNGMRAMLDGPIREAALVYVNGKRAGSVWCAPYELDITSLLHSGDNAIKVVVANSALNILAKGPLPDYKDLTAKYGERFQAQDMQAVVPQPSGIVGRVTIVAR